MPNIFVDILVETRCMARPPSRLNRVSAVKPRNGNNHPLPLYNRSLPEKAGTRCFLLLLRDCLGLERVN